MAPRSNVAAAQEPVVGEGRRGRRAAAGSAGAAAAPRRGGRGGRGGGARRPRLAGRRRPAPRSPTAAARAGTGCCRPCRGRSGTAAPSPRGRPGRGSSRASRTTGSRRSARNGDRRGHRPAQSTRAHVVGRRHPVEGGRVDELGEDLDPVDRPAGPGARTGPTRRPRTPARRGPRAAPARPPASAVRRHSAMVSASPNPQGISTRISGSTSPSAAQVVSTDRPPSTPSSSQPPARRTCSGTQWPTANGGSSHSIAATRGGANPWSRRPTTISSTAWSRSRRPSTTSTRRVLGLGHRAHRLDRVEDPLDRGRLEADDRHVPVEPPGDLVDLAVADGADPAQLLGDDQVGLGRRQRRVVEHVQRRVVVHRGLDRRVDLARGRRREVVGPPAHDGDVPDVGREVAVLADADQLVTQPEREHDLGRGRDQGDDAHRSQCTGRAGVAPRAAGQAGLSPSTAARAAALSVNHDGVDLGVAAPTRRAGSPPGRSRSPGTRARRRRSRCTRWDRWTACGRCPRRSGCSRPGRRTRTSVHDVDAGLGDHVRHDPRLS